MNVSRLSALLAILVAAAAAWPSASLAQDRAPSLRVAELSCPACACERARTDLAVVRTEYLTLHGKVSTLTPRILMLSGFAAAGVATFVSIFGLSAAGQMPARNRRAARVVAGLGISIPLGVGFAGAIWLGEKLDEGAPDREREAQLRVAYKEARRNQKEQCRSGWR